ncbi:hypothetical protein AB0B15_14095 [Streptomyces sp. NPDC045456]|uniref:hypothetical protein n=1 Tax=Streptomyces sp. NPDC045456 TaxID=3155254 RepID=UPI0033E35953
MRSPIAAARSRHRGKPPARLRAECDDLRVAHEENARLRAQLAALAVPPAA